jgi:hypothetical protein
MSAKPNHQPNEQDMMAYIGDMSSALAQLAREHRMAALSYILGQAQMEAENGRGAGAASGMTAASAQNGGTEPRSFADQSGH